MPNIVYWDGIAESYILFSLNARLTLSEFIIKHSIPKKVEVLFLLLLFKWWVKVSQETGRIFLLLFEIDSRESSFSIQIYFNNSQSHSVALQESRCKFRSLLSHPEVTAVRKNSWDALVRGGG